jgi:hypothetical protein
MRLFLPGDYNYFLSVRYNYTVGRGWQEKFNSPVVAPSTRKKQQIMSVHLFFLSSSTDRSKVSDLVTRNYPVDAPPTRKMANRQGNNPTDREISLSLYFCRNVPVGYRHKNYFLYFPIGFWYFTVGFVPTGNFEFLVVTLSHHNIRSLTYAYGVLNIN